MGAQPEPDLYRELAGDLPNVACLGSALINLVEPMPGHEYSYNRYYEDDHFYAGAMAGPWVFAGRRWVATRELQLLRFPKHSTVLRPVTSGCYLATYWHTAGHYDDVVRWGTTSMNEYLYPRGRGYRERENVFTSYSPYEFGVKRDEGTALLPEHALDHPFAGLVLEAIEPERGTDRSEWLGILRDQVIPAHIAAGPAALALAFTPKALPLSPVVPNRRPLVGADRNITLLWFLDIDPRACWDWFRAQAASFAMVGSRIVLAAPFVPTVPGTDCYADMLR